MSLPAGQIPGTPLTNSMKSAGESSPPLYQRYREGALGLRMARFGWTLCEGWASSGMVPVGSAIIRVEGDGSGTGQGACELVGQGSIPLNMGCVLSQQRTTVARAHSTFKLGH